MKRFEKWQGIRGKATYPLIFCLVAFYVAWANADDTQNQYRLELDKGGLAMPHSSNDHVPLSAKLSPKPVGGWRNASDQQQAQPMARDATDSRKIMDTGPTTMNTKTIATEKTRLIESEFEVNSLAWSPDGKYLATTGILTKTVNIWDVDNERVVRSLKNYSPGHAFDSLVYSPDGRYLAGCQSSRDMKARVWDPHTGEVVKDLGQLGPGSCESLAFSRNGEYLAIAYRRNDAQDIEKLVSVGFFETKSWQFTKGWITSSIYVDRIAFSPDDRYLAVGGHRATDTFPEGVVQLWEVARNEMVKTVVAHSNTNVESLAFSTDGKFIASGTSTGRGRKRLVLETNQWIQQENNRAIRLWHLDSGDIETAMTVSIERGWRVDSLRYTADGRYLVSGSTDKTVRIWDATTYQLLQTLNAPGLVSSVVVRPDSGMVAASTGKIVTIWELRK